MITAPAFFTLAIFAAIFAMVAVNHAFTMATARTSLDLRMSYRIAGHKAAAQARTFDRAADAIKPIWEGAPVGLPAVNAALATALASDVWAVIPAPSEFYRDARGCWRSYDTGRFVKSPLVKAAA